MRPDQIEPFTGVKIGPSPIGRGFRLETVQFVPQTREQIFDFFADAYKLEEITPPWLHFSVLTPAPISMAEGTLIDYRLKLHGIPIRWKTRIAAWEPPFRFVDEQLKGPYYRWHHEHLFEPVDGGTLCRDIVDYEVPGGSLIHKYFVRGDLEKIFTYRRQQLGVILQRRQPTAASHRPESPPKNAPVTTSV
ncbi:MAG: SRPBCC family protein [Planctomycetota bacterium]